MQIEVNDNFQDNQAEYFNSIFTHPEEDVKAKLDAIQNLGQLGGKQAIETLVSALNDTRFYIP